MSKVIGFDDLAAAFCDGDSEGQRTFLEHLAIILDGLSWHGRWPMQCRYFTDSPYWMPENRVRILNQLETLFDHLKNPTVTADPAPSLVVGANDNKAKPAAA
jgi:hypothetical protein